MARQKIWAQHGTVRRYRQGGCDDLRDGKPGSGDRCDDCKFAMRNFNQGVRSGHNTGSGLAEVTELASRRMEEKALAAGGAQHVKPPKSGSKSSNSLPEAGPMERAVREQFQKYAADEPVLVEMAISASRIIDNSDKATLHPPTFRQLNDIREKLTGGKKTKSRGRLVRVQALGGRKSG